MNVCINLIAYERILNQMKRNCEMSIECEINRKVMLCNVANQRLNERSLLRPDFESLQPRAERIIGHKRSPVLRHSRSFGYSAGIDSNLSNAISSNDGGPLLHGFFMKSLNLAANITEMTSNFGQNYQPNDVMGELGSFDEDNLCNIKTIHIIYYIFSNQRERNSICLWYSQRIIARDFKNHIGSSRRETNKFLISTYLNFRLFLDELDISKSSISRMGAILIFLTFNIISWAIISQEESTIKYLNIFLGLMWNNNLIFLISIFKAQCSKLALFIYSLVVALGYKRDKLRQFLHMMWSKSLTDMSGSHSKFNLKLFKLSISQSTIVQVSAQVSDPSVFQVIA